jgi:transposase-like protein
VIVLVELALVEKRYRAVLEVINDGTSVTEVARRYGVGRQAVNTWLRHYGEGGAWRPWLIGAPPRHLPTPDAASDRGQDPRAAANQVLKSKSIPQSNLHSPPCLVISCRLRAPARSRPPMATGVPCGTPARVPSIW